MHWHCIIDLWRRTTAPHSPKRPRTCMYVLVGLPNGLHSIWFSARLSNAPPLHYNVWFQSETSKFKQTFIKVLWNCALCWTYWTLCSRAIILLNKFYDIDVVLIQWLHDYIEYWIGSGIGSPVSHDKALWVPYPRPSAVEIMSTSNVQVFIDAPQ